MNVLSLFDGMSCGQIALQRAGIKVDNYYASEIDKYAIKVTLANYPNTIQLGSVVGLTPPDNIDLLIGGSPCQGFSFAGKQLAFDDPRSKLFFEWVRIWKECKPKWWLLENVKMKKEYQNVISDILGVQPIEINSARVSAQNRKRLYWTNIPGITQPEDKGILLKDIVQHEVSEKYTLSGTAIERMLRSKYSKAKIEPEKTGCLVAKNNSGQLTFDSGTTLVRGYLNDGVWQNRHEQIRRVYDTDGKAPTLSAGMGEGGGVVPKIAAQRGRYTETGATEQQLEVRPDYKSNTLTSVQKDNLLLKEGVYLRRLTEIECERLQTVPDNYTNHVSSTHRYKMLGNGWTVDVIAHIFKHIPV